MAKSPSNSRHVFSMICRSCNYLLSIFCVSLTIVAVPQLLKVRALVIITFIHGSPSFPPPNFVSKFANLPRRTFTMAASNNCMDLLSLLLHFSASLNCVYLSPVTITPSSPRCSQGTRHNDRPEKIALTLITSHSFCF